jgi:hypothetical protein
MCTAASATVTGRSAEEMTVDYFGTYFIRDGFDLTRLVNDDLFPPVRISFQSRHYVSAVKLLMVAVSSLGFVEFGNVKENTFVKLLERYADLASVGVTAEELWGGLPLDPRRRTFDAPRRAVYG